MTSPSPETLFAFLLVTSFAALGPVFAWHRWGGGPWVWALVAMGGWMALTAAPSALGLFHAGTLMPWAGVFLFLVLACATGVAMSPLGGRLARAPLAALVAFQGFRLPLELVLHAWVDEGVVPPQMTWTGPNIDVFAGILALLFFPFVHRWPKLAWIPAVACFALLVNVVRVVILSMPTPLQQYEPVLLVTSAPEVWIASVCVAGAWMAHIVTFRALWSPSEASS